MFNLFWIRNKTNNSAVSLQNDRKSLKISLGSLALHFIVTLNHRLFAALDEFEHVQYP